MVSGSIRPTSSPNLKVGENERENESGNGHHEPPRRKEILGVPEVIQDVRGR